MNEYIARIKLISRILGDMILTHRVNAHRILAMSALQILKIVTYHVMRVE